MSGKISAKTPSEDITNPLGIFFLGLILRLIHLGQKSIYVDEGVTVYISDRPLSEIVPLIMGPFREVHPPLYFWFVGAWVKLWRFIPHDQVSYEFFLRFSSVIFGAGCVYFTYIIGRRLFSRQTAELGALLVALSTFHTFYSQELRMYPMLLFFMCASLYSYLLLLEKPAFAKAAGYILCTVCALYTHYFAFYLLAIEVLFLIYLYFVKKAAIFLCENYKQSVKWFLASLIITILAFAPWGPYLFRQTGHQDFTLRVNPTFSSFFNLFSMLAYGQNLIHPVIKGVDIFVIASIIPLFMIFWALFKSDYRSGTAFSAFWLFIPIIITFLVTFTRFHIFEYKYFFIIIPPLALLIASATEKLPSILGPILVTVILAANIYTGINYQTNPFYQSQNWRGASNIVSQKAAPGDEIILHPSMMSIPFAFYFRKQIPISPMDGADPPRLNRLAGNRKRLWLITTPYHPFVKRSDLANFISKKYSRKPKVAAELKNYEPANEIRVYYFDLTTGTKN